MLSCLRGVCNHSKKFQIVSNNKQKTEVMNNDTVTIGVTISASVENVWEARTNPALIFKWFGSDPNGKVM